MGEIQRQNVYDERQRIPSVWNDAVGDNSVSVSTGADNPFDPYLAFNNYLVIEISQVSFIVTVWLALSNCIARWTAFTVRCEFMKEWIRQIL